MKTSYIRWSRSTDCVRFEDVGLGMFVAEYDLSNALCSSHHEIVMWCPNPELIAHIETDRSFENVHTGRIAPDPFD